MPTPKIAFDRFVVVVKRTDLDELVRRHNTRAQAEFYVRSLGGDFADVLAAHQNQKNALARLRAALPRGVPTQILDRDFLPSYLFGPNDLVLVLGPDGLVVNAAKYLSGQPVVAVNPDPDRVDGLLLPFAPEHLDSPDSPLSEILAGRIAAVSVVMARASLNTGQSILAVNDVFIGRRTHASARYRIRLGHDAEEQSSSGIVVSTGAGSTGWNRSLLAGAFRVVEAVRPGEKPLVLPEHAFAWDVPLLKFTVREPFETRVTAANLVRGDVTSRNPLLVESRMPNDGVVFGDGVENDYLEFPAGAVATVAPAERTLEIVLNPANPAHFSNRWAKPRRNPSAPATLRAASSPADRSPRRTAPP